MVLGRGFIDWDTIGIGAGVRPRQALRRFARLKEDSATAPLISQLVPVVERLHDVLWNLWRRQDPGAGQTQSPYSVIARQPPRLPFQSAPHQPRTESRASRARSRCSCRVSTDCCNCVIW